MEHCVSERVMVGDSSDYGEFDIDALIERIVFLYLLGNTYKEDISYDDRRNALDMMRQEEGLLLHTLGYSPERRSLLFPVSSTGENETHYVSVWPGEVRVCLGKRVIHNNSMSVDTVESDTICFPDERA